MLASLHGYGPTTQAFRQQLLDQKEVAKKEVMQSKPRIRPTGVLPRCGVPSAAAAGCSGWHHQPSPGATGNSTVCTASCPARPHHQARRDGQAGIQLCGECPTIRPCFGGTLRRQQPRQPSRDHACGHHGHGSRPSREGHHQRGDGTHGPALQWPDWACGTTLTAGHRASSCRSNVVAPSAANRHAATGPPDAWCHPST